MTEITAVLLYRRSGLAGFSRASIAALSREMCPTERSACVSWIKASCSLDGRALLVSGGCTEARTAYDRLLAAPR